MSAIATRPRESRQSAFLPISDIPGRRITHPPQTTVPRRNPPVSNFERYEVPRRYPSSVGQPEHIDRKRIFPRDICLRQQ